MAKEDLRYRKAGRPDDDPAYVHCEFCNRQGWLPCKHGYRHPHGFDLHGKRQHCDGKVTCPKCKGNGRWTKSWW